jgi:hypothetical protein
LGSQCTNYLQQHKLVLTCVAWGADRKDAVLHSILSNEKKEVGRNSKLVLVDPFG